MLLHFGGMANNGGTFQDTQQKRATLIAAHIAQIAAAKFIRKINQNNS